MLLAFADDIDIIARTPTALSQAFLSLEKEALRMGLKINENKTKYRTNEDHTTKKVFNTQLIGTRRRGRLNLRWIDGLEKDLGTGEHWQEEGWPGKGSLRRPRPTLDCHATEEGREEFIAKILAKIMADKGILDVHTQKNIIDTDSDDENETNNVTPVSMSSETRNISRSRRSYLNAHPNGEMNNIEQYADSLIQK
ncbi:hypothetical protein TNCV_3066671 [Trichonephila clavipes]|nr:hypothetical protein TNCV_3066671 [Trichonephila clavipes]